MEEEILLTQPVFASQFRCVGTACSDNCCRGWNIPLNKTTYHHYLHSEDSEITQIATERLEIVNKSDNEWAQIKINPRESCPFLAEDSLCRIHKKLGPEALSQPCRTYPHMVSLSSAMEEQHSVKLSCPEAVRLLLLNADAMQLVDTQVKRQQDNQRLVINEEARLINLMCNHLLLVEAPSMEASLYAIVTFLLIVQKMTFLSNVEQNLEQLAKEYEELVAQLRSGKTEHNLSGIKPNNSFQWQLLNWMQNFMRMQPMERGGILKEDYLNPLNELMNLTGNDIDKSRCIEDLRHAWSDKVRPWLAAHTHVLRNYLLYRCYHEHFPGHPKLPPLQVFYLLTAEMFFIKSLIAAKVLRTGHVEMNDFINVIYGLHVVTQHCTEFHEFLICKINAMKCADDMSSVLLLL